MNNQPNKKSVQDRILNAKREAKTQKLFKKKRADEDEKVLVLDYPKMSKNWDTER